MMPATQNSYKIAKFWSFFCIVTLVIFILTQKSSYLEIDAFGMWVLSCLAIIYLSRKETGTITENQKRLFLFIGFMMCLLSFISIPLGITNPPYSIGEFSLLLSGIGVIIFTLLNFRSLVLPVSIPFIAVMGYGGYEVFPEKSGLDYRSTDSLYHPYHHFLIESAGNQFGFQWKYYFIYVPDR